MLKLAQLRPKVPICCMLASPAHSLEEVIEWGANMYEKDKDTFTLEWKYDGARVQIHCVRDMQTMRWDIRIFSRHLSDVTSKYPEAVESIRRSISSNESTTCLILDGEVVAVSREGKETKILPFQTLTTTSNKSKLCVYLFDSLMKNDRSLLKESLRNRRRHLMSCVQFLPGYVEFVEHVDLNSADEALLSTTLEKSVSSCCEGLMAKSLSAPYVSYTLVQVEHSRTPSNTTTGTRLVFAVVIIGKKSRQTMSERVCVIPWMLFRSVRGMVTAEKQVG